MQRIGKTVHGKAQHSFRKMHFLRRVTGQAGDGTTTCGTMVKFLGLFATVKLTMKNAFLKVSIRPYKLVKCVHKGQATMLVVTKFDEMVFTYHN